MTGKSKYPLSTKICTLFIEERQPKQRQETNEGGKLEAGEVEVGEGGNPFHVGMLNIKTDTEESAKETMEQDKERGGQEKNDESAVGLLQSTTKKDEGVDFEISSQASIGKEEKKSTEAKKTGESPWNYD